MAWSVKAVIKSKPLADGLFAVYVRLTSFGKVSYIATGVRVARKHWNARTGELKPTAPMSMDNNDYIEAKVNAIKRALMAEESKAMTPKALLGMVADKPVDFYGYCQKFINVRIEEKQFTTANNYKVATDIMREFAPTLSVADVTPAWVSGYVRYLKQRGNADTTINRRLRLFAGVYDLVIEDGLAKRNVFDKATIKGATSKIKEIPTPDDLRALVLALPDMTPAVRLAAHVFLTQFLTRGTRISDIIFLKHSSVGADYFLFNESKTDKQKKINIHPLVADIMRQYDCPVYVFPLCTWAYNPKLSEEQNMTERVLESKRLTSVVNKNLRAALTAAGISKHFSSHCSRHGFATMAIKSLNGDLRKVQGMLNHANASTTEGYAQDLQRSDYAADEEKIYGQIWKRSS